MKKPNKKQTFVFVQNKNNLCYYSIVRGVNDVQLKQLL